MALTIAKGYIQDPNNPGGVIKDPSAGAMPGSVASFTQPTLNSKNTAPTPQINLTPKPDNTNYAGILAGAQQQALSLQQQIAQQTQPPEKKPEQAPGNDIKSYIDSISGVQQPNAMQTYQQGYDQSGLAQQKADINAKAAITTEAQGRLNNISAQLMALNTEAQAIPIQLQQESTGRGRTAGGLAPIQADQLRANALKALPLQAQAAVIQAEVATAQGNQKLAQDLYTQAQDHFDKMFELQMTDLTNKYERETGLIDKVFAFADKQEQRQLESIRTQQAQDFQLKRDTIDFQRQVEMDKLNNQQQIALTNMKSGTSSGTSSVPQTFEEQIADLKLSTGQKSDLVDIQTLEDQLNKLQGYASDGKLEGIGSLGGGALKSAAFTVFGKGSKEGADVRTLIGNLKGQIAKLRGGTSFTANEEKLLNSYVPGINESQESVLAKVRGLQEFLSSKKNAIIQVGGGVRATNGNDPLGIL
jgi:hypothetical protein